MIENHAIQKISLFNNLSFNKPILDIAFLSSKTAYIKEQHK